MEAGGTPETGTEENWAEEGEGVPWVSIGDITRNNIVYTTEKAVTPRGIAEKRLRVLPVGTLLYSIYASLGKVATLGVAGVTNQAILGLIPDEARVHPSFLRWWLEDIQRHVSLLSSSNTQQNLNAEKVRNIPVLLPPIKDQNLIAAFLDRKTAAIDALIAKKERLIELLQEKRQALITSAVTTGLDPNVPMKDSGVEWLGKIPCGWSAARLMYLTPPRRSIMYGIVLPGPDFAGGVPIVKSGDCNPDRLNPERLSRTDPEIEAGYVRSRLRPGDIVFAIRGSVGATAIVPPELDGANLTQDAARIAPAKGVLNQWLLYALQARPVWAQLEAGVLGATVKGINIRDLKRPILPVPSPREQGKIADFLGRTTAHLDREVRNAERSTDLLREYRQALISAAVTGKLNISEETA